MKIKYLPAILTMLIALSCGGEDPQMEAKEATVSVTGDIVFDVQNSRLSIVSAGEPELFDDGVIVCRVAMSVVDIDLELISDDKLRFGEDILTRISDYKGSGEVPGLDSGVLGRWQFPAEEINDVVNIFSAEISPNQLTYYNTCRY